MHPKHGAAIYLSLLAHSKDYKQEISMYRMVLISLEYSPQSNFGLCLGINHCLINIRMPVESLVWRQILGLCFSPAYVGLLKLLLENRFALLQGFTCALNMYIAYRLRWVLNFTCMKTVKWARLAYSITVADGNVANLTCKMPIYNGQ